MKRIRIRDIIKQEAKRTGIKYEEIVGPSRIKQIVQARQYAIWRCRMETDASLTQIGQAFGRRDHTTVLHAIVKINQMPPEERMYMPERNEIDEIIPFTIDISDLRQRNKREKEPIRRRTVFPIRPIYKVA